MEAKPTLASPHIAATVVSIVLAALIGVGLLTAVTCLFQRAGAPFEHAIVAEHACANHSFASERDTCLRSYLAASALQNIARH